MIFPKKDSPISISYSNDLPKFYNIKLYYLKNCQHYKGSINGDGGG